MTGRLWKTAFNLTFSLGIRSDKVHHAMAKQGALEIGSRIAVVAGRAWAKEARCDGVNGVGQPVKLKGGTKELASGCLGTNETAGNIESGMVIDGEPKNLLGASSPPLMDGTGVLTKLADACAAEASAGDECSVFFKAGRWLASL